MLLAKQSFKHVEGWTKHSKLKGKAPLIADPSCCNSTTRQNQPIYFISLFLLRKGGLQLIHKKEIRLLTSHLLMFWTVWNSKISNYMVTYWTGPPPKKIIKKNLKKHQYLPKFWISLHGILYIQNLRGFQLNTSTYRNQKIIQVLFSSSRFLEYHFILKLFPQMRW